MENINNTSISTDDVMPKNREDQKCAPGRNFESGSCFTTGEVIEIAKAYNKTHGKKINLDLIPRDYTYEVGYKDTKSKNANHKKKYNKYEKKIKKFLLRELGKNLGNKCKTQKCWIDQKFMENMDEKKRDYIQTQTLRPTGPSKGRKWLNTLNIDEVMEQYEIPHDDFKYLGTMPRDFQDHDFLKQDEAYYKKLFKSGKTRVAMVYNTDKLGGEGEHWNAMFADFKKGLVLFFDSYGVEPGKETKKHMELLKKVMMETCGEMITSDYNHNDLIKQTSKGGLKCNMVKIKNNDKRHQFKGSECGVYSINFILRMLEGDKFEDICNDITSDDEVNKRRDEFFRDENQ